MALRKQILKDTSDIPCGSQQVDNNSQEEEDDEDNNEELSSSLLSSSTRKKRKIERENKSKQEMTEEEMMDLALRLSEQEASVTALRQQQEEEAMMKAIQESIVSQTQPSPVSQSQSLLDDAEASPGACSRRKLLYSGGKTASAIDQGASADIRTAETDLNQGAKGTGGERNTLRKKLKRKEGSPLLEMPDLSQSQKISAQDSPGSSDCLSAPLDSPQDSKPDQNPNLRLNKAFLSDNAEHEICKEGNSAESELTSDMVLLWSGEDDDVTPTGSHSPVFPEERPLHQAESETAPPNHVTAAFPGTNSRPSTSPTSSGRQQLVATERRLQPINSEPAEGPTVSYYWGVPFCPRGLDPDKYTQVIMAQMEVYEKSLKQAQRFLLRKAEWGGAVLPQPEKSPSPESAPESPPQPVQRRSGLKLKGKKVFEEDDFCPAEAEEEDEEKQEEEGESKEEEKEEKKAEEGGHVDTDEDCEVCPETQLSDNNDDSTQDLMMGTSAGAASECKMSPERPEVEVILQVDSPAEAERQEEMEVEAPVDKKTIVPVSSSDVGGRHEKRTEELDPDVEEIKYRVLQRSSSPELEPEDRVDCPICQSSFPLTQIERHAAYCDGEEGARKPGKRLFPSVIEAS
ncbi:BRCA1-A complex subunit RAP80 isoform X3 [Gymnodraco acuticeps]|uniref:BRCA1-A complex subunit RAP80 isoform X3 n=1 Tax=Gymnodraco acuticeps TaxID=8218 RepID=A0A6P8TVZ2_GYMAC|nr:BRCA1-A complex subunit RAP80 isoform X3 [Gymnodraco acuticeps]